MTDVSAFYQPIFIIYTENLWYGEEIQSFSHFIDVVKVIFLITKSQLVYFNVIHFNLSIKKDLHILIWLNSTSNPIKIKLWVLFTFAVVFLTNLLLLKEK